MKSPFPGVEPSLAKHWRDVHASLIVDACDQLRPFIDQAYRKGRYADSLDDREPADPPLEGADIAWADELLKAAGKR